MSLEEIKKALSVMVTPGDVVELRIFDQYDKKYCGWFNDINKMAEAALSHDNTAEGTYYTCNACVPGMLAIANNRIVPCKTASSESNIERRRIFGLDIDPVRNPVKISSTDEEKRYAYDVAIKVKEWLSSIGFPFPVLGDSGNGYHLDYFVDLPATPEIKNTYERAYKAIKTQFPKDKVDVQGFADANRIWKVYGTVARKGENIPERPHRRSKLLEVPETRELVSIEMLQSIANLAPKEEQKSTSSNSNGKAWTPEKLKEWLESHGAVIVRTKNEAGMTRYVLESCLMNPQHEGHKEAEVHISSEGVIGYKCHHNSCDNVAWIQIREKLEPEYKQRKNGYNERKNSNGNKENEEQQPTTLKEISLEDAKREYQTEKRKLELKIDNTHFICDYLHYGGSRTDAYIEYHIGAALFILSALTMGRVELRLAQGRIHPNLWVFFIGDSTVSRKSTAVDMGQSILETSTSIEIAPNSYSPEALIEFLNEHNKAAFIRDEAAGLLAEYKKPYMRDVRDIDCTLYDGKTFSRKLRTKKGNEPTNFRITDPFIVKMYATTIESFAANTEMVDLTSGWLYRFLFFSPNYQKSFKPLNLEQPEDIEAWAAVLKRARTIHARIVQDSAKTENGKIVFSMTPDALKYMQERQEQIETEACDSEDSIFKTAVGRAMPYAYKIAMLLEIGKQEISYTITLNSIKAALDMAMGYFVPTLCDIMQRVNEDAKMYKTERVLSKLRLNGGMSDHSKLLHDTKLVKKEFDECIETLILSNTIEAFKTPNDKKIWYRLTNNYDNQKRNSLNSQNSPSSLILIGEGKVRENGEFDSGRNTVYIPTTRTLKQPTTVREQENLENLVNKENLQNSKPGELQQKTYKLSKEYLQKVNFEELKKWTPCKDRNFAIKCRVDSLKLLDSSYSEDELKEIVEADMITLWGV